MAFSDFFDPDMYTGFPFGAPGSNMSLEPPAGNIGGASSWGMPPVPGIQDAQPTTLATPMLGANPARFGSGTQVADAGGGGGGAVTPPPHPITPTPASARPGGTPAPIVIGAPPGAKTPPGMVVQPGSGGLRPRESAAPTPPGKTPPVINPGAPGASGKPAYDPAAPAPAPAAGGGKTMEERLAALGKDKDFGAALGKLAGGAGQQGPKLDLRTGSIGGDPAAASRANASQLMMKLLEGHPVPQAGPVPEIPPGILQLMSRR